MAPRDGFGNGSDSPTGDVQDVRPGDDLDWPSIEAYLRAHLDLPNTDAASMEVRQFANGTANLTYLLVIAGRKLVLRRPPFGELPPGAHDMKREFKVLSRLWRSFGAAPRAYIFCNDRDIAGADFFVMEFRSGIVVRERIPQELGGIASGRAVGMAFIDAVADLHLVDPAACDLADLGRPDQFLERQVEGWRKRWQLARPEDGVGPMDGLADVLAATMPATERVSVLHNDLHLGNAQFAVGRPDMVRTLFDWDMATLGDPLVDLGGVLAYWRDGSKGGPAPASDQEPLGLPTKAEIAERYARRTGLDLDDLDWYQAFSDWKIAIIMQQLANRYRRGESHNERLATMGDNVLGLAEEAHDLLSG